ncbi:MAG TPA: ATP-binding protein, partial [Povalibacter sp.]
SGFTGLLAARHGEQFDAESRHYLERVQAGTLRMSGLIDDLLELSRVTQVQLRREPVDLSAIAETLMSRMQEREPHRSAEVVIDGGLMVDGDSRLLEIALDNLFDNAWKFTAGRPLTRIRFGVRRSGEAQVLFVQDNGVGFDPRYASNLFGVFQRLHSSSDFPGTGVGLATVQRIVQRHGGRIWAEAGVDSGATFYFTIAGE